jgi:hypothetical protein
VGQLEGLLEELLKEPQVFELLGEEVVRQAVGLELDWQEGY